MPPVHAVCLANTPPQEDDEKALENSLHPLRTLLEYLESKQLVLKQLVFLLASSRDDGYCDAARRIVRELLPGSRIDVLQRWALDPDRIAMIVSEQVLQAQREGAKLVLDLTAGPKDRAAALYVASAVFPPSQVEVLYARRQPSGRYELEPVRPLGHFNPWLARHGVLMRNYKDDLLRLKGITEAQGYRDLDLEHAVMDVLDRLVLPAGGLDLGPRVLLLRLAEKLWEVVRKTYLGPSMAGDAGEPKVDEAIRALKQNALAKSITRAGQTTWNLRNYLAHQEYRADQKHVLAFLDLLVFLAAVLGGEEAAAAAVGPELPDAVVVAVDGDDIGKQFEERLAQCATGQDAQRLAQWSWQIQRDLTGHMLHLQSSWDAVFLARTGDGFLAQVPQRYLKDLAERFRPRLNGVTASTGVGPTVKEAYLALKLCKAMNRGGGMFFSFAELRERRLWSEERV